MFDISFIELLVVFVVALLVLGPEKLPGAVRTGALWIGRAKRSFGKVKAEIEQQINADDIRRQLHNESIMADIEKARKNADNLLKDTRKELDKTQEGMNRAVSAATTAPVAVPVVTNSAVEGVPTFKAEVAMDGPALVAETIAAEPVAELPVQEKKPVQDFYNSPPTGVVSIKSGKLTAAVANPPAAEQADGKKD
jgi:sec-independent protein translocase protein TatB